MSRLLVVALLVALTACTASGEAPPQESSIDVSMGFTQLLPDEGTPKGLLRVVNEGDEPLAVTGAGLRWSGYGPEFTREQDVTIAPGQTLDLRVLLPNARCSKGEEPISGVVATADETKVQELTTSGQQFLRRLWLRGCRDALVAKNVKISYAPGWRIAPGDESLDGTLRMVRQEGSEPVTVLNTDGSVLYDLVLPRQVTLAGDATRVDVPLSIRPGNRCDEHAIGQATAPFTFRIGVRIGDGPGATETLVLVTPPVKIQEQANRMLLAYCERKAG